MSSVTRVITVRITEIVPSIGTLNEKELIENIKRGTDCDDVVVDKVQEFASSTSSVADTDEEITVEDREQLLRSMFTHVLGIKVVEKMIQNGFCSAPASTKYHGNYPGGLFDHSLAVATNLHDLTKHLGLEWSEGSSAFRVGILHDLCKIDQYVQDNSCVTENNPYGYRNNYDALMNGHSEKSLVYAYRYGVSSLTDEEIACILHHMGAYETKSWDAYDKAIKKFPNVLYTHTADMDASKIMGV